jgi:LPS-assembly lipoprotein
MSRPVGRLSLLGLLAGLGLLMLGGCGFTPLYAAPGVAPGLSAIETLSPEGRSGALLREALDDALAHDPTIAPRWRLEVALKESRIARGRRSDGVASRYEYVVTADWSLTSKADGTVALKGVSRSEVTFDRADQPYAAIAAQQDAEQKVADELARKIQIDLAVWMLKQG